ncbi:LrgB family protein [Litorilituus lipolyticus]|uniref:LrgB family protein n=1 Tax=Litorilituus lipolyticus TaxID=2491017 RepID=A0A502L6G4_9GAMM|nr:LrgB family protein [Litorilituus lipolyticus]TPH18045.1 LrgB family protein [Litorilituus lipolyticus]
MILEALSPISLAILLTLLTLVLYQLIMKAQQKWQFIWLNPMLITIIVLVPFLLSQHISYGQYQQSSQLLTRLLEPAIVALGFPLYQQLNQIKYHWKGIIAVLSLGVLVVIIVSFSMTMFLIYQPSLAIALSLKSVTTPIGIALSEQFSADSSITAFAIIIAGFVGGIFGPKWLNLLGITCAKSQGIAIGAASHVIGTAIVAKDKPVHGAYSSLALIFSALLTAILSPLIIPSLIKLFS